MSGTDARIGGAEPLKVGKLAAGDLDRDGGDTTDWRAVDLPEGGAWRATVSTEPATARLAVGLYDRTGELLVAGVYPAEPGAEPDDLPAEGGGELVLDFEAAEAGPVFVRLMHRGGGKNTWGVKVEAREAESGGAKGARKPALD
jgi:hypothetical protein